MSRLLIFFIFTSLSCRRGLWCNYSYLPVSHRCDWCEPIVLLDVYPRRSINQVWATANPSPEPPLKRLGPAIMSSLWKCNCLSHSRLDNSAQPRTNTHSYSLVSATRFGTLFTSDLVPAALIWLLLAPVHCLSLLISQCSTMARSASQSDPSPLFFPLYLSHWWELDATPPAVPVSSLIDVLYSEVVISRGRTRGCHSSWLL